MPCIGRHKEKFSGNYRENEHGSISSNIHSAVATVASGTVTTLPATTVAPTYISARSRSQSNDEAVKQTLTVELDRGDGEDLGLVVTGGVDKDSPPRIVYIKPDGIACRSDLLEVGDLLISLNGADATLMRHFEIVNLLQNSSVQRTVLELQYSLPDPHQMSFSVICKRIEIRLVREADYGTFGLTLRGGSSKDPRKCRPLTVTQIRPNSPAEREGTLKVGDRILAINRINVTRHSLVEVLQILQELKEAVFLIEYDVSVLEVVQNATGPLLVEIDKLPGYSLGILLTRALYHGKPVLVIDSITPASIADRCGALHIGDHLLSIDGVSLDDVTITEANHRLSTSSGSQLQLEVVPGPLVKADTEIIGAESNSEPESLMWGQGTASARGASGGRVFSSASLNSLSSYQSRGTFNSMTTQVGSALSSFSSTREHSFGGWDSLTKQTSAAGNAMLSYGLSQVCHVDTTEVMLIYDQRSFGLTIDAAPGRPIGCNGMLMEPPIITHIEHRGASEKCGVLQEGDRVLAINGQYLEGRTMVEVNKMIKESGVKMLLLVEFNVAESIIPSSGVFVVKLAKRNTGLGITISCPRNRRSGHLVISDVKKGSVAHRTGSIQPGDKLLAIDNVRLDNCTLEDSARVLQDTQDIVKLTIKKDENFADEPDPTHLITYTVELPKFAGPIGITISGSEEPFDPIFISSLTEGGLAEKTGALHVGDRLLAISGVSLRGKTLSDAIHLLQNAGQTVTLKITRPADKGRTPNETTGKHGSMDSALESWDSSGLEVINKSPSHNLLKEPQTSKGSSDNSERKSNKTSDDSEGKSAAGLPLREEDRKETDGGAWDLVTVTDPSTSVPPSCCSSGGDEWSRQVDELDHLNTLGLDSFSDLPDITEVTTDDHSTTLDAGYITVDEAESRGPFLKSDTVMSGGGDDASDIVSADVHLKEVEEQLQNIFTPTPIELMKMTLSKQSDSEDFGFSVSDGVFEKGVYVGSVRPSCPAAEVLRPYDRLLQVNSVKTKDLDCSQVVPLIIRAGNQVDLVVSRNPLVWGSSEGGESTASLPREISQEQSTWQMQGAVPRNSKPRRVAFMMDPRSTT